MIDICNICGSENVEFTTNDRIYGKIYGNGKVYLCTDCGSFVGCHDNGKPYGILSDPPMRKLRTECHNLFDPIWKAHLKTRSELYWALAKKMGLQVHECHFGMFDLKMLEKAHKIISEDGWYE